MSCKIGDPIKLGPLPPLPPVPVLKSGDPFVKIGIPYNSQCARVESTFNDGERCDEKTDGLATDIYSPIFQYPPGFSKADMLALRKTAKLFEAKGSDHYYCGGDENVHILCNLISFLFLVCGDRQCTNVPVNL